ncbi:putative bifunctional diguanylate cyclase/phosphodiesterase [Allorhizobium borbori]|uniref:Diguanylate cyclase (GGDEF)-like protein n=1 Tax=Allorhizobium borbori TaxID=485907 RepID=A0A7W6P313_9HYPH|nr:EAL domain-containing protein [Allorhizobium borbori]MBB4104364.1 diguanylate cyclase (GGDEF)-like protein [Allorhizobium borbori]
MCASTSRSGNGADQSMDDAEAVDALRQKAARLEKRWQREQAARLTAEDLLETKARELYSVNQKLRTLAERLEERVEARTRELQEARDRALIEAHHDPLTGLYNRRGHEIRLEEAIARAAGGPERLALLMLDLDNFKEINDRFGHHAGDGVLRHVARIVRTSLPEGCVVSRLGGDEFAVIIPVGEGTADIETLVGRFRERLNVPYEQEETSFSIAGSIGIAIFPDHGESASSLLRNADIALYRSKTAGRNAATVFEWSMFEELVKRQEMSSALANSNLQRDIVPWFQPIVQGPVTRTVGVEALVRLRIAGEKLLLPGAFLELANEGGMLHDIFRVMLDKGVAQMRPLIAAGQLQYVSINAAASDFSFDIVTEVLEALERYRLPPEALVIEITEEAIITDPLRIGRKIRELRAHGVGIALDDFGSGYANITTLAALDISTLKLDRSLTTNLPLKPKAAIIVKALCSMARDLGLSVTGEGVETEAEAECLAACGCTRFQGYHYARPMPLDRLQAFLG